MERERFSGNLLNQNKGFGRIEPGLSSAPYLCFLIVSKILHVYGFFLSHDLLKSVHIVQYLFIVRACSSLVFVLLQKPLSSGKRLTTSQWYQVARHAFFSTLLSLLLLDGLTLCGPVRTVLLSEHSDVVVFGVLAVLFKTGHPGPTKTRGALLFLFAMISLLLFDNDEMTSEDVHPEGVHRSHLVHYLYQWKTLSLPGFPQLSDHKGGLLLLTVVLLFNVGNKSYGRKVAVEIGGSKRFNALTNFLSVLFLLPPAILIFIFKEADVPWMDKLLSFLLISFAIAFDFYVEAICMAKLDSNKTSKWGSIVSFLAAFGLGLLWNDHHIATYIFPFSKDAFDEHGMSGSVVLAVLFLAIATHLLSRPSPVQQGVNKGILIGYTTSGTPLYSFTSPQSVIATARVFLKQVLAKTESRQIFYFLCLNLTFTFVELFYGAWNNSLGLISDGFHMLFDCSALVLGLCASLMSSWKPTKLFSYGYGRVEYLSGFVNGLFLTVISVFVFLEALERLFDPPEVTTNRLLIVSVCGLVVNLAGIFAFSHAHSHGVGSHGGESSCQSHGHGAGHHGHSHGSHSNHSEHGHSHKHGHNHGHSHKGHGHAGCSDGHGSHKTSANMQGVFLHVIADTLGSVGVIISSLLIEQFGFQRADPVCSLFIAVLIFASVVPLLKESALVLALRTPRDIQSEIGEALKKVLTIKGVSNYRNQHFWTHSDNLKAGSIQVHVVPTAIEATIISQVTNIFKEIGINNLTIQVEKDVFFEHMSVLSAGYKSVLQLTQKFNMTPMNTDLERNFIKSI
ncbi:zinc transporter 5-like [Dendronephthya gigantea]|uniref:zinc transporter 5-like n=1 Tax=Dendronephthya gigantea TaxID=151771 RepID=UPI00106B8372|nr:zinc transporter 5-like [Dendronephthya gigantea]